MESIPNALVELKTPLIGTIANTTNEGGEHSDFLILGEKARTRKLYRDISFPGLFNRGNNQ